ncbi:MAG: T9SS type A sorting domain-containing protein, partial [Candidatus Cloacimonetes bacterium]|nr:T9SS type A sorting domain-containing protein [Candidatus Cloacimonadota bacterium]
PNSNPVEIEITSDSPLTSICITDLTDVYIIGETDVNGNFSCSIYGENPDALSYTLSAHNKLTFSEQINTVPVIEPPTGSGPENNPIASDVENDQGGWIRIDYILSQNDPYHSEAVTPYIDYYTIERKEGSGEWQPVANYQPQDPIDSNNGTLLIAVPASEDPCAYRMAAVYDPENSTIQSEWADAGAATSKDEIPVFVDLTLFLEGAYQDDGYMRHDLIDNDFLPLISPYNGESVDYFPETGIIPIVDWIEIQLRETEDGISLYSCNAFLLSDGSVVDINGNNSLPFFNTSDREFYLVIRHRNHIDIMTANPYILSDNPVIPSIIDLSQVDSIYGIGFTELADGTIAMLTGDGSNNNQIQNDDKNEFWINQVNYAGYLSADFNLNGQVQNDDKNEYWINNVGRGLTFPEPDPGREFNPSQRYKNNLVASGLNFSFANSQVTEDGYYFEFDIMVNSISTPALLGDTHIYLNYDPQAFGYQAVAYDGIKISKGSLLQGELIPGVALYSEPHSSDNDISRIGIHLAYNFAQLPEAANLIPTSPSCLVHVQIEIADNNASSRISFENSDRVPMNFQQYYSDNSARFNTVVTNAVLNESLDLNSFTESRNTADSYGLMDNYPNPFNAVTNICFILPEDQYCELSVYNIKGQKVKDIFRGEIVKDELNNFIWDGTDENQKNVSSGIYLYRLNAGDHSQIRKMIVNK